MVRVYGRDKVNALVADMLKQKTINEVKSSLVPRL